MKKSRDNFPVKIRHQIEQKSAYRCSNPSCRRITIGPSEDFRSVKRMFEVAHICAAAPGGPRYDSTMSAEERASENNGILLCRYCAALIDVDPQAYPPQLLRSWKEQAYRAAAEALAAPADRAEDPRCWSVIRKLVEDCLCTYQTEGTVSGQARFRGCAGILYRLFFESLPQAANYNRQLSLWEETIFQICSDVLAPCSRRTDRHDRSFPRRYRRLMEELDTYSIQPQAERSRILNIIETEVQELFQTGQALGLGRNNGQGHP